MEPILSLKNVCSYYDKVQVLYDINVDVYPGEIVSVIGANGAGKSTMMKTIMGLVHMGRGEVTFDGKKLNRMHAHKICKAGIAYVPEGREVFPNMTVLENLEMGAYCRSYTAAQMNEKLEEMYTMFPGRKGPRRHFLPDPTREPQSPLSAFPRRAADAGHCARPDE